PLFEFVDVIQQRAHGIAHGDDQVDIFLVDALDNDHGVVHALSAADQVAAVPPRSRLRPFVFPAQVLELFFGHVASFYSQHRSWLAAQRSQRRWNTATQANAPATKISPPPRAMFSPR